jgi:hypothetical protein
MGEATLHSQDESSTRPESTTPGAPAPKPEAPFVEGEIVHTDSFAIGEQLADDLEAAAKTLGTLSPKVAETGHTVAAKVRAAAGLGRTLAGHYREIRGTVGEVVHAAEDQGVPVSRVAAKVKNKLWQTSPLPNFRK